MEEPYNIVTVNDNGTVRLQMGKVTDTVNICDIKPFWEYVVSPS
jgi:hypothetical protein